jgi:hypothetical protein
MKSLFRLSVCLLLAWSTTLASGQRSSYDPAAKQQSKPREGFVDFALKQINSQNTDYGCQMDQTRKLAVDRTIKSIDSWAVLVALTFLVLSFFMLLHQHRERSRREVIAAEFLAQYHNAWVDTRMQAEDAIRRYNELVNTANRAGEAALRSPLPETDSAQPKAVKADLGRDVKPPLAPAVTASSKPPMRQGREPEVDLIAQISTLQQQLKASHEREKNLQKELSKTQRRAPAEQPRDASLPG